MERAPTDVATEWQAPDVASRPPDLAVPPESQRYIQEIVRAANQIGNLFEASASHPYTAISTACRILGLAAQAHTVAVRSLNRDAIEFAGGWSRADVFHDETGLRRLRPGITFDRPILAFRPADMPIIF